jgi:probable rRNA maturation factor
VLITDDEAVRRLNAEYAGEDETTDVLAFSLREGEVFVSPDGVMRLGEVIISYPTASRQAAEAGRLVDEEMAHLLVHGILHLLGYDHVEPEEERVMRGREAELLASLV